MENENLKCVMVIDAALPYGIIANTSAIMGITLGSQLPHVVGQNVLDKDGTAHLGIIRFPVPILAGNREFIKELRKKLYSGEFSDVTTVDFSDLAQSCKTYEEYIKRMEKEEEARLSYFGIAICGKKKKINQLTGNLPLLR